MACVVAVFPSYHLAHRATQRIIEQGVRPRVTYISARASQAMDSAEGFYPGFAPDVVTPVGEEAVPARGKGREDAGSAEEIFTGDLSAGRFAPTGSDNLTISPPLMARLLELGLDQEACERVLALVREGEVAAVYRLEGDAQALLGHLPRDGVSIFLPSGVSLAGG